MTLPWTSFQMWLFHHCCRSTSGQWCLGECPDATCHHCPVSPTRQGLNCTSVHCSSFPVMGSRRKGRKWLTWLGALQLKALEHNKPRIAILGSSSSHRPYRATSCSWEQVDAQDGLEQCNFREMCPRVCSPVCMSNCGFLSWRALRFRSLWV